jgi:lysophospholipase L1-like esterase
MRSLVYGFVAFAALALTACGGQGDHGFQRFKQLMSAGNADRHVLVLGDSTSHRVGDRTVAQQFIFELARHVGETTKGYSIAIRWFDKTVDAFEQTWMIKEEGTRSLTIHNASGGGFVLADWTEKRFGLISDIEPDLIILNVGLNMTDIPEREFQAFKTGLARIRERWPTPPIIMHLQQPLRDNNRMASVVAAQRKVAALFSGITVVDTYSAFMKAGKPLSWYRDDAHTSAAGNDIIRTIWLAKWDRS